MNSLSEQPRVGVASFIINKEGKILLGKRKNKHGYGLWGLPGGKLEMYEEPLMCALRETFEETGMIVKTEKEFHFVSAYSKERKEHWITLLYICTPLLDTEPKIIEPDKVYKWQWFYVDELKQRPDLFYPLVEFFKNKKYVEELDSYVKKYGFRV